jgi:Tfp pilus assembly protein PilO
VYDYAALASSIDYLAATSGVKSNTSIGQDLSASALSSANTSSPVEIPLSLQVTGSYDSIKQYILNLEHSIRPIHVSTVMYSGSNRSLDATIQAVTYYQPSRSLDVLRSAIQ